MTSYSKIEELTGQLLQTLESSNYVRTNDDWIVRYSCKLQFAHTWRVKSQKKVIKMYKFVAVLKLVKICDFLPFLKFVKFEFSNSDKRDLLGGGNDKVS